VKTFVKTIYPISSSMMATNCSDNWELAILVLEYLFVGIHRQYQEISTKDHGDFQPVNIRLLNIKAERESKIEIKSGRYRRKNAVPK
jgi:hypothetical protein